MYVGTFLALNRGSSPLRVNPDGQMHQSVLSRYPLETKFCA
jgi:hypothetical protein